MWESASLSWKHSWEIKRLPYLYIFSNCPPENCERHFMSDLTLRLQLWPATCVTVHLQSPSFSFCTLQKLYLVLMQVHCKFDALQLSIGWRADLLNATLLVISTSTAWPSCTFICTQEISIWKCGPSNGTYTNTNTPRGVTCIFYYRSMQEMSFMWWNFSSCELTGFLSQNKL